MATKFDVPESSPSAVSGPILFGSWSGSSWPQNLSITAIRLNGSNYDQWAKSVEVYFIVKKKYKLVDTPDCKEVGEAKYEDWKAEDAHNRIILWNNMEPKISGSLVFLVTAKGVWDGANEMFSGLDNLHHTYELHHKFFYLTLDDMSLEDYYARFRSVCQKLDLADPVSTGISVMQKQRESMRVAHFLSDLLPILTMFVLSILGLRNFPP